MVNSGMRLTPAQRLAVNHDDNTLVVACPGSGKTRVLVAKLLRCLDEVRGSAQKLACITYTNAAVFEIEDRLRTYGTNGDEDLCEVSTIHSFCLNSILRHFYWWLPDYPQGFTVLPPETDTFIEIVNAVSADHWIDAQRARDAFAQLNREPDGSPIVGGPVTPEAALDFWARLQHQGFIDFPNIVYQSFRLMTQFPNISCGLACRFPWLLVDEFQDTSALQIEILDLIAARGKTKFFLVGDPCQSIFGFAGAHPRLMDEFAERIGANRDFPLPANFRSSELVIEHAELLIPREPAMTAEGEWADYNQQPRHIHAASAFDAITDYFIPALIELEIDYGKAGILAPSWFKLLHLGRQLRDYGIPIIGPGARPYRRSNLFALLAEQICEYIEDPNPTLIKRVEKELFNMLNNITGSPNFDVYTYLGRVAVFRLIRAGRALSIQFDNALEWLRSASEEFASILVEDGFLAESKRHLLSESVDGMERDMLNNGIDTENLAVADLGMFASYAKSIQLLTMHRAKGREFDAVAIIDLHDGRLPNFRANSDDEIAEARRLFYVAITRAKGLLMYITDDEDDNPPTRFLYQGELGIL
jgi:DNA helicase II / ATP-dependent DNA helicase PcrA